MENQEKELKLNAKVAEKFDLVSVKPGKHKFPQFGEIDLTELTVEDADSLVNAGFAYLKKKATEENAAPAKDKAKEETAPAAPAKTK